MDRNASNSAKQGYTVFEANKPFARLDTPIEVEVYNGLKVELQYQGWPTICKGDGDTLYLSSSVRTSHIDPHGAIGFAKSLDGGKTWSPLKLIIDTPADDRDTGIVYLGNGHLVVFWFTRSDYEPGAALYNYWGHHEKGVVPSDEEKAAVQARFDAVRAENPKLLAHTAYVMHSMDGGETWDTENLVTTLVFAPHGATVMADGKSMIYLGMAWGEDSPLQQGADRLYLQKSVDGGYTWTVCGKMIVPDMPNFITEPHVIQLKDGSYVGAFRREGPMGMRSYVTVHAATDGELNDWSEPTLVTEGPGGPPHLLQLKSGAVLLTYGYRGAPECGVRAKLSLDGGKTFGEEMIVEISDTPNNGDLGYPSTVELDDGTLVTICYQRLGDDTYCSVLGTRWTIH